MLHQPPVHVGDEEQSIDAVIDEARGADHLRCRFGPADLEELVAEEVAPRVVFGPRLRYPLQRRPGHIEFTALPE